MSQNKHERIAIAQDLIIIFGSIVITVILLKTGIVGEILTSTREIEMLGSFVAGILFTSIFTTAPAIVTLGEIARENSLWLTTLFGGLGAVIGDLFIFQFIRSRLSEHLAELIQHKKISKRISALFRMKYFYWLTFLVGGLIIASPLPDEIGVSLLGLSRTNIAFFILISFLFNSFGIFLVGITARAL